MAKIHPTKAKLIETFLELAEELDINQITVDAVLTRSKVAKGSLYHHFENFHTLTSAAVASDYAKGVDQSIALISAELLNCRTKQEFLAGVRRSIEQTTKPESALFRLNRARILGRCAKDPDLRARIRAEQGRLSATLGSIFSELQKNGFIKTTVNVPVAVLFIQAYTLGKVIDDIGDNPVNPDDWTDLIYDIISNIFVDKNAK